MSRQVALLRGINVGGNKRIPMADLRKLAQERLKGEVQSYIQSGNLVLMVSGTPQIVENALEQEIAGHFGFEVEVICRNESQWTTYLEANPFAEAARDRPKALHLGIAKEQLKVNVVKTLQAKATLDEKIATEAGALYVDFVGGVGESKLSPSLFDRAAGSSVTLRNWSTVQAMADLLKSFG